MEEAERQTHTSGRRRDKAIGRGTDDRQQMRRESKKKRRKKEIDKQRREERARDSGHKSRSKGARKTCGHALKGSCEKDPDDDALKEKTDDGLAMNRGRKGQLIGC